MPTDDVTAELLAARAGRTRIDLHPRLGLVGLSGQFWPLATHSVRLPRTVHHHGDDGFAGMLTGIARQNQLSGYPGDGSQRWPAVHALDAAVLFRLVLEKAPATTAWHAVADEGDAVADIAAVIGRRLGVPVQAVPEETYGPLGAIFAMDQPSSSARPRTELDWQPRHPGLLEDLENIQP